MISTQNLFKNLPFQKKIKNATSLRVGEDTVILTQVVVTLINNILIQMIVIFFLIIS